MSQGFARILPSGRAVRWVKPSVADYRSARNRAASQKISDLADALLPYVLRGITAAPVARIDGEPARNKEGQLINAEGEVCAEGEKPYCYIDEEKMIASVANGEAGGWVELTYEMLVRKDKGADRNKLGDLFDDYLEDYVALEGEIGSTIVAGFMSERPPMARPVKV